MNDLLVSIDSAGRVVLPRKVREELEISPGDLLKISIQGDQVTLRPNRERAGFIREGKALVFSAATDEVLSPAVVETARNTEAEAVLAAAVQNVPRARKK